jgi:hypothetical protein
MYHAESEWRRMGLPNDRWRISKLNASYDVHLALNFCLSRPNLIPVALQLCKSYPALMVVPAGFEYVDVCL